MATVGTFSHGEIAPGNKLFSSFKTLVESAFYGNNVEKITDLAAAYELARKAPGAAITDMPVKHTAELGLPEDAKVIVFNDGKVTGGGGSPGDRTTGYRQDFVRRGLAGCPVPRNP